MTEVRTEAVAEHDSFAAQPTSPKLDGVDADHLRCCYYCCWCCAGSDDGDDDGGVGQGTRLADAGAWQWRVLVLVRSGGCCCKRNNKEDTSSRSL